MPVALIAVLVGFLGFSIGETRGQYVKVVHIDESGVQQTERVLGPILVVNDGDSVSVRSGFEMKGRASRMRPKGMGVFAQMDGIDFAAAEFRQFENERK